MLIEIYTDATPLGVFGLVVLVPETGNWAYSAYPIPHKVLTEQVGSSAVRAELYAMLWSTAWAQRTWPEALVRAHTDSQVAAHAFGVLVGNFSIAPGWAKRLDLLARECDPQRCLLPVWLAREHTAIVACDRLARSYLSVDIESPAFRDRSRTTLRCLEAFFTSKLGHRSAASRHVRRQLWRREPRGKLPNKKAVLVGRKTSW